MAGTIKKSLIWVGSILMILYALLRLVVAPIADDQMNRIVDHRPYRLDPVAQTFHSHLTVMDWHADTLLWNRGLLTEADRGHVDLPRLMAGNVGIQMFTTVTKTPRGQNMHANDASSDNITLLAFGQGWPARTWNSLIERALYQAEKLDGYIAASNGDMMWIRNQPELTAYLSARATGRPRSPVGALLGTEGAHPLEGDIRNIDRMYDAGFRMAGLVHFFDNRLGGSLHGQEKSGLTDFGRKVVRKLEENSMIIDLAHASEQTAWDTLAMARRPVVVSHTGFRGHCDSPRNISDELMQAIASKGGLIAVGFWHSAVCGDRPENIADALIYGIDLVGADHVALGSDWDGTIRAITAADVGAITQALMEKGVSEQSIEKVMGGNSVQFLARWLPQS